MATDGHHTPATAQALTDDVRQCASLNPTAQARNRRAYWALRHDVETDFGSKGSLNGDLKYPAPGVTYVVGDRFVYMTDPETRTVRALDVQAARGPADRSESSQAPVGRPGGTGYDGGHLHQNAHAGGAERINIVAMLQELNRSGTTEFGSVPNSFYAFETELRGMVDAGRNVSVDLHVRYPKDSTDRTPTMIRAGYTVDGGRR